MPRARIALLLLAVATIAVGSHWHEIEAAIGCRYANRLIGVGFTVIDPEGYEIEQFDEAGYTLTGWTWGDRE